MRYTSESFIACISGYKGEKARGDGGGGGGVGEGIHTGFYRFTKIGEKHGRGDFRELKSQKFPGEHALGPPQKRFRYFGTGHYFS